jgi:hypothetical protein
MSHAHTKDEVRLSQERRDAILTFVLDYLTGDQIDRKTLGHFAFIAATFGLTAKVREMVGKTSSVQGRQELCISLALAALNLAVSDEPVEPTTRQMERKESRDAAKEFERRVAGMGKPERTTKYYHAKRAKMTEAELTADRAKRAAVMREIRAKHKGGANQAGSGGTP